MRFRLTSRIIPADTCWPLPIHAKAAPTSTRLFSAMKRLDNLEILRGVSFTVQASTTSWNMALLKTTAITESKELQLRFEAFKPFQPRAVHQPDGSEIQLLHLWSGNQRARPPDFASGGEVLLLRGGHIRKRLFVFLLAAVGASFALVAQSAAQQSENAKPQLKSSKSAGQQVFASTCAGCHGLDGRGGERAPNIAQNPEGAAAIRRRAHAYRSGRYPGNWNAGLPFTDKS